MIRCGLLNVAVVMVSLENFTVSVDGKALYAIGSGPGGVVGEGK